MNYLYSKLKAISMQNLTEKLSKRIGRIIITVIFPLLLIISICSEVFPRSELFLDDIPPKTGIAKSTVAFLANPFDKKIQRAANTFIQAGTRILVFYKLDPERQNRLILTEYGVWAYISNDQYFNDAKIRYFRKLPPFVFITRYHPFRISESLDGKLTPTETYEILDETSNNFKIKITNRKFPELKNDWSKEIYIPKSIALKPNLDDLQFKSITYFSKGFIDKIYELFKPCSEKIVSEKTIGAKTEIGTDLSAYIARFALSFNAKVEKKKVETYSEEESINKRYYTRNIRGGDYSVTRIQKCKGPEKGSIEYHFINPEPREFIIDKKWADSYSLLTDQRTGEVIVSCYQQYDKFAASLKDYQVPVDEIPFVIAMTAKWKNYADFNNCLKQ